MLLLLKLWFWKAALVFLRLKIVKTNTKYIQLVAIRLHLHKLYRLLSLAYGWHLLLASRLPSLADDNDNLRQDVVKHNNNDGNDGNDVDADDVAVLDAFDDVTGRRLVLSSVLLQSVHVRSTINGNSTVFSRSMPISSSIFNSVQRSVGFLSFIPFYCYYYYQIAFGCGFGFYCVCLSFGFHGCISS